MNIVISEQKVHNDQVARLADLHPEEIVFFKKRFVWASNRTGFYTKTGYDGGWMARKRYGVDWMPLFPKLVDDLVEKHLDFDRFCMTYAHDSPVRPEDRETAFWFGTMAGEYTYHDCFDIDSHDRVGWYGLPTRWHPDRNDHGSWASPYLYRRLPVMRIGLPFFAKVKKLYDLFPGRVWAFSSASLGLYAYLMYSRSRKPRAVYAARRERLREAGLKCEVYPEPPKTEGSKGRHQRRPCGMDSGVITDQGIVTDPIEQIRVYMRPTTPSFESICEAVIKRLTEQYKSWLAFHDVCRWNKGVDRAGLWSEQQAEIDRVRSWLEAGCPEVAEADPSLSCTSLLPWSIYSAPLTEAEEGAEEDDVPGPVDDAACVQPDLPDQSKKDIPDIFERADLKAIDDAGQWVQWVVCLATNGFLADDTFMPVISSLTKWLYYVEMWDVPDEERRGRIKAVLKRFCESRHNGHISRLLNGDVALVHREIDHLVDTQVKTVNDDGHRVFEELRRKRASGRYVRVIMLEPVLSCTTLSFPWSISSAPLRAANNEEEEYDNTALPDELQQYIISGFKKYRMPLRRNKEGVYPTLEAITRLINHLAARTTLDGRLGQDDFAIMGFAKSNRDKIKKILYRLDVIREGDYRAKRLRKRYFLGDTALELLGKGRPVAVLAKAI